MPPDKDGMDFFNKFCKSEFNAIKNGQKEVIDILKGTNGAPGLCERIRNLERRWKIVIAAIIFLIANIAVSVIDWVRDSL